MKSQIKAPRAQLVDKTLVKKLGWVLLALVSVESDSAHWEAVSYQVLADKKHPQGGLILDPATRKAQVICKT